MSESKENKNNILDIKSSYIIKQIFSLLKTERKLSIIIYNKKIQSIFGLNPDAYKKISNRYKVGEKNEAFVLPMVCFNKY